MYYCYWSGHCTSNSNGSYPIVYGTATTGIGSCLAPPEDAPGCSNIVWELVDSSSNAYCSPDNPPDDPGTPGAPTTPPDPVPPIPPKTPCQTIQTVAQAAPYQSAVSKLKYLSNNPPRDANGKPLETGITFLDPTDNSTYVTSTGAETDITMGAATGGLLGGSLHNHPPGDGTLPLFSPSDLYSIYQLLTSSPPAIDPTTYTATVIIHNGQSYMLTITDPSAFIAFGTLWFSDQQSADRFINRYYNENADGIGSQAIGITGNEKAFLNMLKREDMGLALLKQNAGNTSWQQLALNSSTNTVSSTPCP